MRIDPFDSLRANHIVSRIFVTQRSRLLIDIRKVGPIEIEFSNGPEVICWNAQKYLGWPECVAPTVTSCGLLDDLKDDFALDDGPEGEEWYPLKFSNYVSKGVSIYHYGQV